MTKATLRFLFALFRNLYPVVPNAQLITSTMVNAIPFGYFEDGDASSGVKHNRVLVENKERILRKAFLVVMLAFVVVCSIRVGTSLDKPASSRSSNLFGERSLKGLFGLCGKKDPTPPPPPPAGDGFTAVTWGTTVTGIAMPSGATKMYKATVPADYAATVRAAYAADGGTVNLYLSTTTTKPDASSPPNPSKCVDVGDGGSFPGASCGIGPKSTEGTVYVWVDGVGAATTIALSIGVVAS